MGSMSTPILARAALMPKVLVLIAVISSGTHPEPFLVSQVLPLRPSSMMGAEAPCESKSGSLCRGRLFWANLAEPTLCSSLNEMSLVRKGSFSPGIHLIAVLWRKGCRVISARWERAFFSVDVWCLREEGSGSVAK